MRPDHDVFLENLYRTYFPMLCKYAACALEQPELAEEVVQDAFHEAVQHIDILIKHPNPGGWLKLTVKNKIAHARRDMNRYMLRFISLEACSVYENKIPPVVDSLPQQAESLLQAIQKVLTEEEWQLLRRVCCFFGWYANFWRSPSEFCGGCCSTPSWERCCCWW